LKIHHDLLAAEYAMKLIDLLATTGAHRATKFISETLVVRATRIRYRHRKSRKYHYAKGRFEVHITCCKPNYTERKFIKQAKQAKCRFPITKTRLQY